MGKNTIVKNEPIEKQLWAAADKLRCKTYRQNEILFIDACNLGHLINRRTKEFSEAIVTQMWQVFVNQQR